MLRKFPEPMEEAKTGMQSQKRRRERPRKTTEIAS
jgi:hypothetical protein